MKSTIVPIAALLALAACDSAEPDSAEPTAAADPATAAPAPAPTSAPTVSETPAPTAIPVAMHGRWGMVPNDCDPARADAKGLLEITANKLEFYESVGTLDTLQEGEPTRIRASFDFEGEGMTWERDVTLDVQDDGATLIRREYGDDAAPGPFRYAKCN